MMTEEKKIIVHESAAVVRRYTLLSRGLGFAREMIMANLFGTTLAKSAFDIAFLIPNLFRRVLGEGAFSAAFVPVHTEVMKSRGRDDADRISGSVLSMLGCTLIIIVVVGIALISLALMYPGLAERVKAPLLMLRVMLPYAFFICMVAGCIAVLNSLGRFAIPAISPVLLNIVWIGALLFACPRFGATPAEQIYGVAWGVLGAGAVQLLLQVLVLAKCGFSPQINFDWRSQEVRKILKLMGPAAVGMGIFQFNFLIDRLLAMCVADWAPAALTFSERLIYFPLGVFATALGTVLLPTFSRQVAGDQNAELLETLSNALKSIVLVMLPASVGIFVLARPLVQLVFEHGVFTSTSTTLTARALWFYSPGLLVFSLHKVFVPAFYAMKDTVTPVRVGMKVVVMNLLLNVVFILTWPDGYKHSGLACATVLASVVNSILLGSLFTRKVGSPGWGKIMMTTIRTLVCSALMGVVVFYVEKYVRASMLGLGLKSTLSLVISITSSMLAGALVYFFLTFLVCRDDFRHMLKSLRA